MTNTIWDAIVIGAGAAGMMCAAVAGQRGARVLLIDHAARLAEKIRISGGGRCNFTNINTTPAQFISGNPAFCRSALARYSAADFLALVRRHRIAYHEKHKGQLFCDHSSEQIIELLRNECDAGAVRWAMPCKVQQVTQSAGLFEVATEQGVQKAQRVVVATGGLSIPKIGATDFGHRLARQFKLKVIEPTPALVPLTFDASSWSRFVSLAGIALPVTLHCQEGKFEEDLLFTHRGLSGPAILQISSYWQSNHPLTIDLIPQHSMTQLQEEFLAEKRHSRRSLSSVLASHLPSRLADQFIQHSQLAPQQKMAEISDKSLRGLSSALKEWHLLPSGTEGWRKAEVTRGGVDTNELNQSTLEARQVPGLYFVGEVVDVTGWLGGYNFQWAWSSGYAAGMAISNKQ